MNETLTELVRAEKDDGWTRVKSLVFDSATSSHSKRAYEQVLDAFDRWCRVHQGDLQAYRQRAQSVGLGASSINVRLSAIRKLAADGLLAPEVAAAVSGVKGAKRHGVRARNG